ncbi:MAG TPA: hypothetical protein PKI32_02830 [Opitutales bacterium]|nr:hypothetical protein [Opitutales bacterium]
MMKRIFALFLSLGLMIVSGGPMALKAAESPSGYSYAADFSVADDVGEAYGIDIERISHYSHGHGKTADGHYAILLNGNRHYLATPKLGRRRSRLLF